MSLRFKLLIIVVFVAAVPIAASAWISLNIHRQEIEKTVVELQRATANRQADRLEFCIETFTHGLIRVARDSIDWNALSAEERQAGQWLVYREDAEVVATVLLDAQHKLLLEPAYVTADTNAEEPEHRPASPELIQKFLERISTSTVHSDQNDQVTMGEPFLSDGDTYPVLPIALRLADAAAGSAHTVAVALSLRSLCRDTRRSATPIDWMLVDSRHRQVCPGQGSPALQQISASLARALAAKSDTGTYHSVTGQEHSLAYAKLSNGWYAIAHQPSAVAYAATRRMARQSVLWIVIAILIALTSGWFLARGIIIPLRKLVTGARALACGDLDHRLETPERDEIGLLGKAFNQMADELKVRDQEIRDWNQELQARVKERTRAIEVYHQHLIHAEKTATMASLSAGVATEINDPLTAILGAVQLLRTRARGDPTREQESRLLANAETGAIRVRQLVKRVQDLAQRQPHSQLRPIRVRDLVGSALTRVQYELDESRIELVLSFEPQLPYVLGNFTQIEQALVQLLSNAIIACLRRREAEATGSGTSHEVHGAAQTANSSTHPPAPPTERSPVRQQETTSPDSRLPTDSDTHPQANVAPGENTKSLRIVIVARSNTQRMVDISVIDGGIGLPEGELNRIFEPFATFGDSAGTGLGLTVARHVIEEHGGTLWATLNDVSGCTFHMRLPQANQ